MDNPLANLSHGQKIAVIVGSVGVGGFMVYKHHADTGSWNPFNNSGSSTGAATATTSTTSIDPVTGLPVSQDDAIDPATNMAYLAEAQQYGSVQAAEAALQWGGTTSSGGSANYSAGTATPTTYTSSSGVTSVGTYTSNAAWAQAVQAGLVDIGYDSETVSAALGGYLAGQALTSAQAQIVQTAIGEFGPAPVGNLQVVLQPASSASTTTTGSSGTSASTGLAGSTTTGTSTSGASTVPVISGGHVVSVYSAGGTVAWTGTNATSYHVMLTGPGSENGKTNTVTKPSASYGGLESGHNYEVTVTPYNSAGQAGKSGVITFKTT